MAPKAAASGEKKPAQPAKKAVAKKSTAGRKKGGSKKAVESYKIYIYKVLVCLALIVFSLKSLQCSRLTVYSNLPAHARMHCRS